ncbi:TRAP-type C4-dicarboxylate transport system, substrate-binding protein [Tistlia consotensis]|uniref:TRAP-type C4-dicarboxylate transport system, substrate-binding protein n=1 Tax=Tistlia consotensis USBA 355 TaxID=560819 RepID=A0A1Y6CNP5_9PROT|nr:TRAP transporter substrate-binding protein [Tistlia consotensis]SMF77870.1 TRAP-type C4-dicarboxylate transport system, substrate-binding protein [Tistlia consotensis USBA 355]SNS20216.1 TRAP-type C4-dicarboxylate transport system, substrate-binding protein [Tistlia consotensis]
MTRWTRRDVLKAGAAGALAAGTFAGSAALPRRAAAADAKYTLKLHHFLGPTSPAQVKMLAPWAKRVEEGSGGAVKIEIYPSMSLGGKPPELIRQVRDGVVDIVWTVNGYTPGLFPRSEVFELPFVHTNDPAATNLAMADLYKQDLAVEYKGIKPLFLHVHAGQAIHMVDTPVHTPDDMAGKKIRIPTRTGAWVLEALGANPVGMPVPELPQALSKKVVDGALIPWEIIPALKLQDLIKDYIEGPNKARLGTTTFQVSMNGDKWASLPKEIQAVFEKESGDDWLKEVGKIWRENDDHGIEIAEKAGGTHIVLTDEQWAKFHEKLEPVVGRWVDEVKGKSIDGKALVEAARAAIAKHTM